MHILLLFKLRDNKSCKDLPKMLKHEFYLKVAKFQKVSVCVEKVTQQKKCKSIVDFSLIVAGITINKTLNRAIFICWCLQLLIVNFLKFLHTELVRDQQSSKHLMNSSHVFTNFLHKFF